MSENTKRLIISRTGQKFQNTDEQAILLTIPSQFCHSTSKKFTLNQTEDFKILISVKALPVTVESYLFGRGITGDYEVAFGSPTFEDLRPIVNKALKSQHVALDEMLDENPGKPVGSDASGEITGTKEEIAEKVRENEKAIYNGMSTTPIVEDLVEKNVVEKSQVDLERLKEKELEDQIKSGEPRLPKVVRDEIRKKTIQLLSSRDDSQTQWCLDTAEDIVLHEFFDNELKKDFTNTALRMDAVDVAIETYHANPYASIETILKSTKTAVNSRPEVIMAKAIQKNESAEALAKSINRKMLEQIGYEFKEITTEVTTLTDSTGIPFTDRNKGITYFRDYEVITALLNYLELNASTTWVIGDVLKCILNLKDTKDSTELEYVLRRAGQQLLELADSYKE